MESLRDKLDDPSRFLYGMELVSTRGTMNETRAVKIREMAGQLADCPQIDWVSITDNAGGNPMLGPSALGKPILYAGTEVIIHLSCKDYNRNGLESAAWLLASEGFDNILTLSGDAPIAGHEGAAKPVFDIDSVGLLSMLRGMNQGLSVGPAKPAAKKRRLHKTEFYLGAVVTNFKLHENEVIPQYLKLEKKIECGAEYIINQIGYDSRKIHELVLYMKRRGLGRVPLIGNVYMLNPRVAEIFHSRRIPGVHISDELLAICRKHKSSPDKGKGFFRELAAKQCAIYRGLGYRGAYLGGIHNMLDVDKIFEIEKGFSRDDWKQFAREIRFSRPGEFFLLDEDPETGLAADRLNPLYEASLEQRRPNHNVTYRYRIAKRMHHVLFTPGRGVWGLLKKVYAESSDPMQGPKPLRVLEHAGKVAMFGCKDCGDCSLPDIAYLCPESACAKNQRNGPCGGTRDGKCEVHDFECIWSRAYDRMKYEGKERHLLDHAPVIQDQGLRGTSSWGNLYMGRDHTSKHENPGNGAPESKAPNEQKAPRKEKVAP